MSTREHLSEYARVLSDDALMDRLRGKGLTELAEEVTRHELAARGIDVERALSEPPASPRDVPGTVIDVAPGRRILRRALRSSFLFGAAIVLVAWIVIAWGIRQLVGLGPIPLYVIFDHSISILTGVVGILLGYRVLGPKPGINPKYDAHYAKWTKYLKWPGWAMVMLGLVQLAVAMLVRT